MALEFVFANNAASTLAGPINNTTTALAVSSGGGAIFPNPVVGNQQFAITLIDAATGLNKEICYVTAVTVDTFTILRGQEGTAAQNWLAGDLVQELWTAGQCMNMIQSNQIFLQSNTFYVNGTTGNDSNPGTNALPFKTIQACVNSISTFISLSLVTVNVAAGTYAGFSINSATVSNWSFVGSGTSTCTISCPTTATNGGVGILASGTAIQITGFTFSTIGNGVQSGLYSTIYVIGCNFHGLGTLAGGMQANVGIIKASGTMNISGSFSSIFQGIFGGSLDLGNGFPIGGSLLTVTYTSVTVASGTAFAINAGNVLVNNSFCSFGSTGVTGPRFSIDGFGTIQGTGSITFFAGSSAGTIAAAQLAAGFGASTTAAGKYT